MLAIQQRVDLFEAIISFQEDAFGTKCSSYRSKGKGRDGPTLGVRFIEVSVKRESTCITAVIVVSVNVALTLRKANFVSRYIGL